MSFFCLFLSHGRAFSRAFPLKVIACGVPVGFPVAPLVEQVSDTDLNQQRWQERKSDKICLSAWVVGLIGILLSHDMLARTNHTKYVSRTLGHDTVQFFSQGTLDLLCCVFHFPSISQTQEDEGTAQQHAAAATIQARLRSHLISKSSTTASNTATATNSKKNKTVPAGGSGGGSLQQGESLLSASSGKESTFLSPATSGPIGGGGSGGDAVDGGVMAGQPREEGSTDKTSSDVSRATVQLQVVAGIDTKIASPVSMPLREFNEDLLLQRTPARSLPRMGEMGTLVPAYAAFSCLSGY